MTDWKCLIGRHKWGLLKSEDKVQERYDSPFPNSIYFHEVHYTLKTYLCSVCGKEKDKRVWALKKREGIE